MAKQKYKVGDMIQAIHESKGMVYVAARKLGCAAGTIYNYAEKHPTVQEAIDQERGLLVDTAELALWKALQNGEGWAVSLTLKTLGKDRGYVERTQTELSGKDGGAVEHEVKLDFSGATTEQLVEIARQLKGAESE